MTDKLKAIQDAWIDGYAEGESAGMANLDQAWEEINALGGVIDRAVPHDVGYDSAIGDALEIIEKLGGVDPLIRSKE